MRATEPHYAALALHLSPGQPAAKMRLDPEGRSFTLDELEVGPEPANLHSTSQPRVSAFVLSIWVISAGETLQCVGEQSMPNTVVLGVDGHAAVRELRTSPDGLGLDGGAAEGQGKCWRCERAPGVLDDARCPVQELQAHHVHHGHDARAGTPCFLQSAPQDQGTGVQRGHNKTLNKPNSGPEGSPLMCYLLAWHGHSRTLVGKVRAKQSMSAGQAGCIAQDKHAAQGAPPTWYMALDAHGFQDCLHCCFLVLAASANEQQRWRRSWRVRILSTGHGPARGRAQHHARNATLHRTAITSLIPFH